MAARTRHKSSSHMSNYVGTGKELLPSELPTVRDLLRYGVMLKELSEQDKRNYVVDQLVGDMVVALKERWQRANAQFKDPIINHDETLNKKVKSLWEKAVQVSLGKGKLKDKDMFTEKLDKLVDILNCKCEITLCIDASCKANCKKEAHIKCTCKAHKKIPVLDLAFIHAQRVKTGSFSTHQMGLTDFPETRTQEKAIENRELKDQEEDKRDAKAAKKAKEALERKKEANAFIDNDDSQPQPQPQLPPRTGTKAKKVYNTRDISNIALASMRHHTGLRETSEIATAAWIDAGLITAEDTHLVIDHNKLKRAQEKVVDELQETFENNLAKNKPTCVFFDGRRDLTCAMMEMEGSDRLFPGLIKEEHYAVCSEPGGQYLWHFVPEEATKEKKHAEIIADHIVDWLVERGLDGHVLAIGGDSTNVNTGWEGGVMQWVEKKLGRKLVWLVCDLHTGELGLRHLVIFLDGPTLSSNKWSGPLGGMLDNATELEINPNFSKITIGPPLIELSQEVIKDLSTDQNYSYLIVNAIRSGELPKRLACLEIGPVCHSRWLTTACRFCRIWVSHHGLKGKNLANLRLIIEFIVGVYFPNWFEVKVKHSWVNGPDHYLYQLELLRSQKKKVVQAVMPTVRRSAWYAHSEAILQAMLTSEDRQQRLKAVEKIMEIRGEGEEESQVGDSSVRPRTTPEINAEAKSLYDMIDWTSSYEPPLTCAMTTACLKTIIDSPMQVPSWPSHTQSIERCVKMVTEAAAHVYSQERREGYIRSQVVSRELMSRNRSKQDIAKLVKFRNTGSKK